MKRFVAIKLVRGVMGEHPGFSDNAFFKVMDICVVRYYYTNLKELGRLS